VTREKVGGQSGCRKNKAEIANAGDAFFSRRVLNCLPSGSYYAIAYRH
jgi:hypothetical protein